MREGGGESDSTEGFRTQSTNLSLDVWRQPSTDRPIAVQLNITAVSDGNDNGYITIDVDESGGTNADYTLVGAHADDGIGAHDQIETTLLVLPTGSQYRVVNETDPTGYNTIFNVREVLL